MQEVLDAMFERKVTAGESVIEQGDDGDNFYVIERLVKAIEQELQPALFESSVCCFFI